MNSNSRELMLIAAIVLSIAGCMTKPEQRGECGALEKARGVASEAIAEHLAESIPIEEFGRVFDEPEVYRFSFIGTGDFNVPGNDWEVTVSKASCSTSIRRGW